VVSATACVKEKTRSTWQLLRRKEAEYAALQAEIGELRRRVTPDAL
jgi:hypothetical protein